jgi:hypothetical protein
MASIFLSHSSQDNEAAWDLSRRLKEHGYDSLFLDFDPHSGIKAGRDWERELYQNLKRASAVVVLCSPHSMASRWCFVEIAQAKSLGKAIFPVKISPCEVETILEDRQVIDFVALGVDEGCRRLFDGLYVAGLDPRDSLHWDPKRPPYPGLHCFDAEDAGSYFGREDEVRQVIESLTRMRRQGEPRLLVVVGSSGSGKSSLVRAGVLPRLKKDRSRWAVIEPFCPGADPLGELARSLAMAFPEGPGRPDWKAIRDRFRDESCATTSGEALATSRLTEYVDELTMLVGHREASVLLVVDQVEEMFQGVSRDDTAAFFGVLQRATERLDGRFLVLMALRSDFLDRFQNHPALRGLAFADLPLGLMPVENFPQVIEGPADRAAIALEPGLVASMIADARTDDALPLLAFTLREMYERCRDRERLTLKVYRDDLGGIQGAVAHIAGRIKTEVSWTPDVGRALRRAFLKLVRVNDEGQFTRQPCRWADLPDLAAPVLEAFVKTRLLCSDGDIVEVAHESLFRVWPELASWLDEGRELMLWKRYLQYEVNAWIVNDRSPDYLLSGARVSEGRRWLARDADDFTDLESEFIAASIVAEDKRKASILSLMGALARRWLLGRGIDNSSVGSPSPSSMTQPARFYSCFISYSTKDEKFARKLHDRMVQEGVLAWFAPKSIRGGEKIYDQIDQAIQTYEKLILVLSQDSMRSDWVMTELRKAFRLERKEGNRKLFPIRLTGYDDLRGWECFDSDHGKDLALEVREYFIPDFSNWNDRASFEDAFGYLIRDLKSEGMLGQR